MNQTEFAVSRFENTNGVTSWRVSGWLHGVRIRKNFKTREEAAAEKAAFELKAMQVASGLRPVATSLTEEQVRDAEAAFRRLVGNPRSLAFYLDFALANYREPEKQKLLSEAVTDYVAAKKHELNQDHISLPQYDRIRWELKRLDTHFARKAVAEITATALVAFLELGRPGMKTYNNRRGVLSTFFKYAFQRGWIPASIVKPLLAGALINEPSGRRAVFDAQLFAHWEAVLRENNPALERSVLLEMQARLLRLGASLPARANTESRRPFSAAGLSKAERMACFVAQHYLEKLTVERIAKVVGLHPNYAMHLFQKTLGTTLIDYITKHRVSHAQRLLATSDAKINDVAADSGFSSISRFNIAFRKTCGCSPRDYRRSNRIEERDVV